MEVRVKTLSQSISPFPITPPAIISFKRWGATEEWAGPVEEAGRAVLVEKEGLAGRALAVLVTRVVLAPAVKGAQVDQVDQVVLGVMAAGEETAVMVTTLLSATLNVRELVTSLHTLGAEAVDKALLVAYLVTPEIADKAVMVVRAGEQEVVI
jgi:hypothetical protein